jgi:hypothetical protein
MSDGKDGIHMHVTEKGKIMLVCRKARESVTFQLNLENAKSFRDDFNSTVSQLEQDAVVENE